MKKILSIDTKISMYGNSKEIERAEDILSKNIPDLSSLDESHARLKIQEFIDKYSLKARILFDGNTVWSKKRILKDVRRVKVDGMEKLSDYLYEFFHLCCGSIAHYSKYGWIEEYPTLYDLEQFLERNEFGVRVYDYIPQWKTDVKKIIVEIEKELKL